jgi:hypothetical protein
VNQETLLSILDIIVPCATGAFLAIAGLVSKYPTRMKYVYRSLSTWIYISLSSGGSLLFTLFMEAIGAKAIGIAWLNSIILGIIGPAAFLGVVSRLPSPGSAGTDLEDQFRTLRDYVYDILDKSISKQTIQIVELKISYAVKDADPLSLLREVDSMLKSVPTLSKEQREHLNAEFDEAAENGDYAPILRELNKYYDVDYIIKRLNPETEQKYMRSKLRRLVRVALESHEVRKAVAPEFIIAKVQALQKDPDGALYHLEQALRKMPSLKQHILTNESDWWILASMTHGERQQEKLETLLSLAGIEQLSLDLVKQQCALEDCPAVRFLAVKRSNGDCIKITLKKAQATKWWVSSDGDKFLDKDYTDLDEAISHLEKVVIPIRLV